MLSEKKLLVRAALLTVFIAFAGIGILYLVQLVLDNRSGNDLSGNQARESTLIEQPVQETTTEAVLAESVIAEQDTVSEAPVALADLAFIHAVFPLISEWKLEAVQPYFSADTYYASEKDAGYQEVLSVLSAQLGELYVYDDPRWLNEKPPLEVPANSPGLKVYAFTAYFSGGSADVTLTLAEQEGLPSLYAFRFDVN